MILGMVLKSLVFLLGSRSFSVRASEDASAARFLAEAGLARVQQKLTQNADWAGSYDEEPVGTTRGGFSVTFGTGSAPGVSVNNMGSASPTAGPRGPNTVPPYTSDVVVRGHSGGKTYELEALVSRRLEDTAALAIAASGRIRMRGNVSVSGLRSLSDNQQLLTGIHSNSADPSGGVLTWQGSGDQKLEVTGDLSATSTSASAIQLSGLHSERSVKTGVPPEEFPRIEIKERVDANSDAPAPSIAGGGGDTNLAPGRYYVPGDLNIAGDVQLRQATLYVGGSLNVNGSIRGTGSVFVKGRTSLRGDADVSTANPEGVAIYSHDSVELKGFDGKAYLQELASSDPVALGLITSIQLQLDRIQQLGHPDALTDAVRDVFHSVRLQLGREDGETDYHQLKLLRERIDVYPGNAATRSWLMAKILKLQHFFDDAGDFGDDDDARRRWSSGSIPAGFAETLSDDKDVNRAFYLSHRGEICSLLDELTFNKLGTA